MIIIDCILKIYPDWRGVVWENDYDKIKPHELEIRPIPTKEELEKAWEEIQKEPKPEPKIKLTAEDIDNAPNTIVALKALMKKLL